MAGKIRVPPGISPQQKAVTKSLAVATFKDRAARHGADFADFPRKMGDRERRAFRFAIADALSMGGNPLGR